MPKSFLARPSDANLAERLTVPSHLHSNIANNDLQVFFLVGHGRLRDRRYRGKMPATPLFALIYEEGCVKLGLVLEVPGGYTTSSRLKASP